MADDADYLFTVAEVATAFAGFAGLVTVIAQRIGGRTGEMQLNLLRNMLLLALLVVLAGLVPHVAGRLGLSDPAAWRVAGAVFFFGWLAYAFMAVPVAYRYVRNINPREKWLFYPHTALHFVAGVSLACVLLGLFPDIAPGLYSLGLFIILYMAAYLLLRLFLVLARG